MLNIKNLEKFTNQNQTSIENIVREYCQHLFLSYLYKQAEAEKLLFKGGTALRIVFNSPRYSEDLDFTGVNIIQKDIEELFIKVLANLENTGIKIALEEGKSTTGGYLGIIKFHAYNITTTIQVEVSLRNTKKVGATRVLIENDYIPAYTLVHLPEEDIIKEKIEALLSRKKPRDFYDYFFLLSGNYPATKERKNLEAVLKLLQKTDINFRNELREFLPNSHAMHLKDFKNILEQKIQMFLK